MNATLVEPDPLPIFRRPPSPEVDAEWNRLANIKPIVISRTDVMQLGRDPSVAAKWPESFGFGPEAYIGRIDVFHQIHCLDWLRREANFDHYYGRKWPPGTRASDMHRTHVSHCIYLLLQNLMCNANVDIYTHYWADAQLNAFPDFSVNHKCRNFDTILKWQEENSVDVDLFGAIRKPPDYEARIMSHRFKELFGWFNSNPDDGSDSGEIG
jgi:Mycotoxin biosynthesis protein UstYa